MPPTSPRLRILSVGGNAVSAFLSWRLSATQACDVTLVWKSGFDAVHQYGISFRSDRFGNERFKPRHVVRSPEEAAGVSRASFDYVLLCVKALPDVYDLASVIESVVSPQHTCILVNTTQTLGVESYLEQRFPTNVVLSLVSGVELTQLSASEFEHKGSTELWVGAANKNPAIPPSIQTDMAEALAMTLKSGSVDCEVSPNIHQQQFERMIGPIAFHPASVLFETPSHADLLQKVGARQLVTGVLDELLALAKSQQCEFKPGFREEIMEKMITPAEANSIMYQDFQARRPMEVETYLGSPIKLGQQKSIAVPRIETLYALMHNMNIINQNRPQQADTANASQTPMPRMSSLPTGANGPPGPRPPMHSNGPNGPHSRPGMRPGSRAPSMNGGPPPVRRGPNQMNGYGPRMSSNGYGPRGPHPPNMSRRGSMDENDLEEFSHLMLYDTSPDGGAYDAAGHGNIALRERELALRQKELALREREYNMRRASGRTRDMYEDDDEDGEDYFDAMAGPHMNAGEADNFDMMSVTSRRTRKTPSASQLRNNPEMSNGMRHNRMPMKPRPPMKNRTSATLMADMPGLRDEIMNSALVGYSSDRYGNVDRLNRGQESRTNSLTAERLNELQQGGGFHGGPPGPYPMNRRGSQSPGHPLGPPGQRPPQRPSPPNGYAAAQARRPPSPPGMRQPVPRHPPGRGNNVAPQQVEQQTGVSNLYPPKSGPPQQVRSLTGSASASAGSGESNRSAPLDSEPSAHSSSSSLGPRPPIGVR